MESLNEKNSLIRGCLRLKRMYKGMKHIPHGVLCGKMIGCKISIEAELDKRFPNAPSGRLTNH